MLPPAIRRMRQHFFPALVLSLLIALTLGCGSGSAHTEPAQTAFPAATVPLTKLSSDPYTNSTSQHATEVEPDTFAFGSTIVTAFQVGRIHGGGASDIGFATSTDAGTTWNSGFLPGITTFQDGGSFSSASDASVAYDAAHGTWLIASLGLNPPGPARVLVSRSPDAINWGNPIVVTTAGDADKNWIVCDNNSTSQFYGHCYIEWDDVNSGDLVKMNTSADGGLTWGSALSTADGDHGIGGQPLVQPDGKVIVPIAGGVFGSMLAFSSSDGGANWSSTVTVSSITDHTEAGGLRSGPLPSAEIDANGTVYVVWADCRFRTNCSSNDLVLSTSADGGQTWSAPVELAGPMSTSWLPNTFSGLMVADYISTSYVNGNAFAVFAAAKAPSGSTLDEAMYTTTSPLAAAFDAAHFSSRNERPVPNAKSDHGPAKFYDLDHEHPIPPKKRTLRHSARR